VVVEGVKGTACAFDGAVIRSRLTTEEWSSNEWFSSKSKNTRVGAEHGGKYQCSENQSLHDLFGGFGEERGFYSNNWFNEAYRKGARGNNRTPNIENIWEVSSGKKALVGAYW